MKTSRLIIIIILLFLVIMICLYTLNKNYKTEKNVLKRYNKEYEVYLNKKISGTELATLINKVINQNEENKVEKNSKNHYIDNEENSIIILIKIKYTDETYSMEEFYNNDMSEFIKHFSEGEFKCDSIEYHQKTGKVSKMMFLQQ